PGMTEPAKPVHPFDLLFAIPNAGGFSGGFKANVVRVARLRAEGVKSGVYDLMLAVPLNGKAGLFIEMKRRKKCSTSDEQATFGEAVRVAGYEAVVCKGYEPARECIEAYLAPLRKDTAPRFTFGKGTAKR